VASGIIEPAENSIWGKSSSFPMTHALASPSIWSGVKPPTRLKKRTLETLHVSLQDS